MGFTEKGEGIRVEIDLIDMLSESEGVLVGDSAIGYVCVLAETRATKYLSELSAGGAACVTDGHSTRGVTVGMVKTEKRPFVRVV